MLNVILEFLSRIDMSCFLFINGVLSNSLFDFIMPLFHHTRYFIPLLLITWIMVVFYDKPNRWKIALIIPLAIILVDQSGLWIKKIVSRPRPFVTIDPEFIHHLVEPRGAYLSFPSNHAGNNAALAIIFSSVYHHLKSIFWCMVVVVMFSRIYIGVHYPLDVLSGCLLGSLYGLILVKGWDYFISTNTITNKSV